MLESEDKILEEILNNTTAKLTFTHNVYLVLLKKQKGKDFCTFFLTDCSHNIWIEKIDLPYCQKLKEEMKVKTSTETFAKHFVEALKGSSTLSQIEPHPIIKMQLKISEGLIINCSLELKININKVDAAPEYSRLARIFCLQLYEAKQSQIKELEKQLYPWKEEVEESNPATQIQKSHEFARKVLDLNIKKEAPPAPPTPKNRDLINPLKKKRKQQGMKLGALD